MKVTVITPCFNPGRFLLPMLESVASQKEYVAKHLVMDGGSTDGTVEVLRSWAKGHPYFDFVSEKDNGQSDACQKALSRVETEYFFWLNADDIMCEGGLSSLIQGAADARVHPAIVYGDYLRIDGDGRVYAKRRQPTFSYWDCLHGYLTVQNVSAIFNAPMLRALGGFDTTLKFVMDYDMILKLGKIGPVIHVPRFCGAFRVHADSKTTTIDDVCRRETEELRTKYGVPKNVSIRRILLFIAKVRVYARMLIQGCMKDRLY